jgi:hypothetical protein
VSIEAGDQRLLHGRARAAEERARCVDVVVHGDDVGGRDSRGGGQGDGQQEPGEHGRILTPAGAVLAKDLEYRCRLAWTGFLPLPLSRAAPEAERRQGAGRVGAFALTPLASAHSLAE